MKHNKGCVYLVGAGPGDAGLITLRGYKLLLRAECVVYDRLVSEELLKEVPDTCECIYVGKENHHHTLSQEEINALLVEKAGQYGTVVRLKGGDPYVFGRGGEEALYLLEHGISFEVVPGVTSAVAAAAYAGIPVTHRGIATGFHVVTAHDRRDELAELDFDALARGNETCVFLMGLSKLEEIAERLMAAGMKPSRSAAVISHGTMPEQQCVTGCLENIAKKVREEEMISPAVIVVGDVVELREKLQPELHAEVDKKLNQNLLKRYLLPKIGKDETTLARHLRDNGVLVDEVQVGEICYPGSGPELSDIEKADWLVFTSRHGVEGFLRLWEQEKERAAERGEHNHPLLQEKKIAAIGESTARFLRNNKLKVDLMPDEYNGAALAEKLKQEIKRDERVVYLRAAHVNHNWKKEFQGLCRFQECIVYENKPSAFCLPRDWKEYDGIIFTCASSVTRFMSALVPEQEIDSMMFYSIGAKTTEALRAYPIRNICQSEQSSYLSLAEQILGNRDNVLEK